MGEYLHWFFPWLCLVRELRVPVFVHAHGCDVSEWLATPEGRAACLSYNDADGIITMSRFSRDRLVALGIDAAKVHVIPYGVDVPDRPLLRAERGIIRCVAVGRLVPKKAPLSTLHAFLRASQVHPSLRLDYVGTGELSAAMEQRVRTLGLDGRVTLHGAQPHEVVLRLLQGADIFLQHSVTDRQSGDEEGLPVAILEAMAQGLPVVSTRHAGIPEAVLDGVTGYLVEEGDSLGMAERIVALAGDPDVRARMGEAGWRRVREHFSWEKERAALLTTLGLFRDESGVEATHVPPDTPELQVWSSAMP